MNEFYDKMLPKAVEKLGKAHGVKVQRGVDTTGNPVNYIDIPPAWKQEILKKGFSLFAAGGSVFDKMHAAKHMAEGGGLESFIKSLGSQGAAFGTQTEQEKAGWQRDPISEAGKFTYDGLDHLAKDVSRDSEAMRYGNHDQVSGKSFFEAGMLPMGTGAVAGVPMRAGEAVLGAGPIRAYHGSPHDFDRFDISKIGTGEGAQSYGHGLYFAENKGTAKAYREALAGRPYPHIDPSALKNELADIGGFNHDAIVFARTALGENRGNVAETLRTLDQVGLNGHGTAREAAKIIRAMSPSIAEKAPGRMYEVNINAKPEQFLDWDKPIGQQGEVMGRLKSAGKQDPWVKDFLRMDMKDDPKITGELFHDKLKYRFDENQGAINPFFRDAGIPGIKYLDQGSRAAGDGSRNYVVFDPKIIEIMKKYGMTLPAATAAYEAMKSNQEKTGFKKGGSVFDKMKRASK
jgi:hypothetical protein